MWKLFVFASLCTAMILGTTRWSYAQSTAVPMSTNPIQPTDFGFSCNFDNPATCKEARWIPTKSQPGLLRMLGTGATWHRLSPGSKAYNWHSLDVWLDAIAAHQPRAGMYTFFRTPCWLASESPESCKAHNSGTPGSGSPPSDLTSTGSPAFNAFVEAVVKHCSPAGHCMKDYFKYYEMWNEPNDPRYWSGSAEQLYQMVKPAVAIVRASVPGAIITTPAPYKGLKPGWMDEWLELENKNGRLSDLYGFHAYMSPASKWSPQEFTPEKRFEDLVMAMVWKKNKAGWNSTPWMNTETGFLGGGPFEPTDCPLSQGATNALCDAYLARWFVLQFAYGAEHIDWYWFSSIGPQDATYEELMSWLVGSHFTGPCTNKGDVYECPMVQANNRNALIVWKADADCSADTCRTKSYTAASQFRSVTDLKGKTSTIPANHVVDIGAKPILIGMD
jgi:polysaccharide biosynthesis protein PslG